MNSATLVGLLVCAITLIGCGGGADGKLATASSLQANSQAMARALGASVVDATSASTNVNDSPIGAVNITVW